MYNKTVIRFGFCDIQNNEGLGKGYQPQLLPCEHRFRFWRLWLSQFQECPSSPPLPLRAFVRKPLPGDGTLSILLEAVNASFVVQYFTY